MAVGFSIQPRGLKEVIKRIETLSDKMAFQVKGELKQAAEDVRTGAIKDAPSSYGGGGGLISAIQVVADNGGFTQSVQVNKGYAAAMEWGTKSKVRIPSLVSAYAAQFKGQPQSGEVPFKDAILAWVKRKGIGAKRTKSNKISKSKDSLAAQKSAAYAIMRTIYVKGVSPHPFFFKHVFLVRKKLEDRLKRLTI